jgi:serine/threonine-protein kinase
MTALAQSHCPWCGLPLRERERCAGCGRPPVDSRVGMTLGGKYRIDGVLSQGGVGRVYLATHLLLCAPVVIKFLLARWASEPEWRARFTREAMTLARLHHPGIVTIHDFGEQDGTLYIVMEHLRGQPLSRLAQEQVLQRDRLRGIFGQILEVLEASHGAGVVHRDMKPENVMVLPDPLAQGGERVKVLDFGIALLTDTAEGERLTAPGMTRGTPHYMSPEQCRGEAVGPATDVYAVGVMLYEVLAGALPFSGSSQMELMAQHMYVEPPPMRERGRRREVPPALEGLVRRALAKRAADRPGAAALRAALLQALDGEAGEDLGGGRGRLMDLSRAQRALPLPAAPAPVEGPRQRDRAGGEVDGVVALWGIAPARAEALRSALGVNGITALSWDEAGAPPAEIAGRRVAAVLLPGEGAGPRLALLRGGRQVPVLVIDVAGAAEVSALIRAGASDVTLRGGPDSGISRQLGRLMRAPPRARS